MAKKSGIINFTYKPTVDHRCWKRYDDFIRENKDVWGLKREPNKILKFKDVELQADVRSIVAIYDKVFPVRPDNLEGYIITTPFSMINDDGKFSETGIIYLSLFTSNPYLVLAHEIFHIYFEKYTRRNIPDYAEAKEYFTVIMNDLFDREISSGYPKHQEIREKILKKWKETKSLNACIALLGTSS